MHIEERILAAEQLKDRPHTFVLSSPAGNGWMRVPGAGARPNLWHFMARFALSEVAIYVTDPMLKKMLDARFASGQRMVELQVRPITPDRVNNMLSRPAYLATDLASEERVAA